MEDWEKELVSAGVKKVPDLKIQEQEILNESQQIEADLSKNDEEVQQEEEGRVLPKLTREGLPAYFLQLIKEMYVNDADIVTMSKKNSTAAYIRWRRRSLEFELRWRHLRMEVKRLCRDEQLAEKRSKRKDGKGIRINRT